MSTLAARKRRELSNAKRRALIVIEAPGRVYQRPFGKAVIYLSGRGQPGTAPEAPVVVGYNPPSPGTIAGYNPPTPGDVAYNPATPGTIANYNPVTPGNLANYNPPTGGSLTGYNPVEPGTYAGTNPTQPGNAIPGNYADGTLVPGNYVPETTRPGNTNGTMTITHYLHKHDGNYNYAYDTIPIPGNPQQNPYTAFSERTENAEGAYYTASYAYQTNPPYTLPAYTNPSYTNPAYTNPTTYNAPIEGTAYYNQPVPGNAVYSPVVPGNANYNPSIPGNANYNPPVPSGVQYNPSVGGSYAGTNPATGGNVAGYNPDAPGNLAGYNPVIPGSYGTNPAQPGQIVYTVTNGPGAPEPSTYVSGYYSVSPSTTYNPSTGWYSTVNVERPASYYVPGNQYYTPATGGNEFYNPPSPGNANYNPLEPGSPYYNPPVPGNIVYTNTIPGNALYNPDLPGNANFSAPVPGNPGAPFSALGVAYPAGGAGSPGAVVGRTMVFVPYTGLDVMIEVPPGAQVVIEET